MSKADKKKSLRINKVLLYCILLQTAGLAISEVMMNLGTTSNFRRFTSGIAVGCFRNSGGMLQEQHLDALEIAQGCFRNSAGML